MVDVSPDAGSTLKGAQLQESHVVACQGAHTDAPLQPFRPYLLHALGAFRLIPRTSYLIPLVLLTLAACAGNSADPADTVEQYITAKVAGDRDALQRLLCSNMEADLEREAMSVNGVDATVENMSCARDGDANTVTCSGAIVAVYAGENREFPLSTYNVVEEDGEWKWCGEAG